MAQLVVAAAGAAVGFAIGGPAGAYYGWAAGAAIGAVAFAPDAPNAQKSDAKVPKLQLGQPMQRLYGTVRIPLSPRWQSEWRANANSVGGKGGGGGGESYTYSCDLLTWCADASGPIKPAGWLRLWWNGEMIASRRADSSDETVAATTDKYAAVSFFDGNAAQLPWSVYETAVGTENADAHRRIACIAFENLNAGTWTNLPLIEAEVYTNGEVAASVGDGLLCHADAMNGADYLSALGPDMTTSGGVASGPLDPVFSNYADSTASATGITGVNANASWRVECWRYIETDDTNPIDKTGPAYVSVGSGGGYPSVNLTRYFFFSDSSFHADWYTQVSSGNLRFGPFESAYIGQPLAWNHVGLQYNAATNEITAFCNGKVTAPFISATSTYPDAPFEVIRLFQERDGTEAAFTTASVTGPWEELYFRNIDDSEIYATGYAVPSAPFDGNSGDAVTPGPVDLADVVSAECVVGGLDASDFDVTALAGIDVRGFIAQGSARQAIEDLMGIFHFYSVCTDKLYFRLMDAAAVATIPYEETGAAEKAPGEPFTGLDRGNDLEVPAQVTLVSPNPSADYDAGAETSDRLVTAGNKKTTVNSAVVLTPDERKGRANTFALDARMARHTAKLAYDDTYAELECGDVVTVYDTEETGYTVRIARETYARGVHDTEVRLFDRAALHTEGTTSDTYSPVIDIVPLGDTELVLLDTGLLRDADDGAHIIAGVAKVSGRWPGAAVFKSIDGATYASVVSTSSQAVIGETSDALPDFSGWTWDESGTVTVDVGDSTLTSSSRSAMQADASINLAAIGVDGRWEIIRYRTVTAVSAGVFTLSGLLRGLKGTESHRGDHDTGDTFVKLDAASLSRIALSNTELGLTRYWKGATIGQAVGDAATQTLSPDGVALKPYAPTNFRAARDGSNNATLTWQRRPRLQIRYGGSGGSYVPLGEASEAYDVVIYADGTYATEATTLSATSETVSFSAADQTGAGLTPGDPIYARIYQRSAVVGRGYPLEASA